MPQDIEKNLLELDQMLYNVQSTYGEIARTAAAARFAYDIAYAKAVIDIDCRPIPEGQKKSTVPVMEAQAVLMVEREMEEARLAEAELDIARKTIDNIAARLSSCQTRSKMTQIEMGLAR